MIVNIFQSAQTKVDINETKRKYLVYRPYIIILTINNGYSCDI